MKQFFIQNRLLVAVALAGAVVFAAPFAQLSQLAWQSSEHSYILLVPWVSLYLLWLTRNTVFAERRPAPAPGVALMAAGVLLRMTGMLLQGRLDANDFLVFSTAGVWLFLIGLFVWVAGVRAFGKALFPLLFAVLMVPLPTTVLNGFVRFLQVCSAEVAAAFFALLGVPFVRDDMVFALRGIIIEVAPQCSGIRSSLVLIIVGIVAGRFFLRSNLRRLILVLAVIPVAIVKNGLRIAMLGYLGSYVDTAYVTNSALHHSGGYGFMIVALLLLAPLLFGLRWSEKDVPEMHTILINDNDTETVPRAAHRRSGARRFLWLLRFSDFGLEVAGWLSVAGLLRVPLDLVENVLSLAVYVIISLLFFRPYGLYNPHLFFSLRQHFVNAFKAVLQAGAVIALLVAVYRVPTALLLGALGVLLLLLLIDAGWVGWLRRGPFHLFRCCGVALVALGVLTALSREGMPPLLPFPAQAAAAFGAGAVLALAGRFFLVHVMGEGWLRRSFRRQVVVMGTGGPAVQIVQYIIDHNAPFWVAGTVGEDGDLALKGAAKQGLGPIERLPEILQKHDIDELVVAKPDIDRSALILVLDFCMAAGVTVWLPPEYLPIVSVKLYTSHFCGLPMICMCNTRWLKLTLAMKHFLGFVLSSLILLALLPLFAVIAVAIKLSSPGPVFYVSNRIGRYGREFPMVKFRSMRVDNDDRIHKEYVAKLIKGEITTESAEGTPLKIVDDPRVTSVGKVLRKWSLDELPQLFNVIRGDMSLVGPRPCLPYEYEMFKEWYKKRSLVRPGITGLWQVAGRSEVDFEDGVLLDLYYVYNRGLSLDLNIMIETAGAVLAKRGAH